MPDTSEGTVYLLHFDRPLAHARHYMGWTNDLERRVRRHRTNSRPKLMQAVRAAGIEFTVARTWPGSRRRERQLKEQGGHSRHCPICKAQGAA